MNIKSPYFLTFLAIILYLVSMLIFVTIKYLFNEEAQYISAFASILGGVGAISAGIIAIYLFNDWRALHRASLIAKESESISSSYKKLLTADMAIGFLCLEIQEILKDPTSGKTRNINIVDSTVKSEVKNKVGQINDKIDNFYNNLSYLGVDIIYFVALDPKSHAHLLDVYKDLQTKALPIYRETRNHKGEYTYVTKASMAQDANKKFVKIVSKEGTLLIEKLGKINKIS